MLTNDVVSFEQLGPVGEPSGVVVEHWTPNREVLGSMSANGTVLCP